MRGALLAWYDSGRRDLPWRRTRDPYALWLAEVMLQQTRVEAVKPYYERFLNAFPNVQALATADLHDVLRLWAGLGYYSRGRNLHAAANAIAQQHAGVFPNTALALQQLPGVGRYTAAAVASIAFGQRAAVLDGNVKRVLARLLAVQESVDSSEATALLWERAEQLLDPNRPGDFNQALMELGATTCTPRNPACHHCPLAPHCRARRLGIQDELPLRRAKKPVPHVNAVAAAIQRCGQWLLVRRPPRGLLGGLWELPSGELGQRESPAAALRRVVGQRIGVDVHVGRGLGAIEHVFSHRRLTLAVFFCTIKRGAVRLDKAEYAWLRPAGFESVPLASLDRRALGLVQTLPVESR